jgi:hypothetical protein
MSSSIHALLGPLCFFIELELIESFMHPSIHEMNLFGLNSYNTRGDNI